MSNPNDCKTKDEGVAIPVPDNAGGVKPHPTLGTPEIWWIYKTADGKPFLFVCRFTDQNGSKQDRPLTYRQFLDGSFGWRWKSIPEPRILYNLDQFVLFPKKDVLVCEGEKATEAASGLFPGFIVTTSPNGSGSPHLTDWTPCKGRNVIIWPDNDQPGQSYARKVAGLVMSCGALSVSIVQMPSSMPDGWDLADSLPSGLSIVNLQQLVFEAKPFLSPYEECMQQASLLTEQSSPASVKDVLQLSIALTAAEQHRVKQTVSKLAKIPLKAQESALKEITAQTASPQEQELDHLDLARIVIDELKRENILSTTAHLWLWKGKGYWEAVAELDMKNRIQNCLDDLDLHITRGLIDAVHSVVKNEVYAEQHMWDLNPDIINVLNGELHLEDGMWVLKPHRRENYRITQIPHEFAPKTACPKFEQFLAEVFVHDEDKLSKRQSLLELIGYTLTNTTKFEKFIILIGSGANGKSVLLEILAALLGSRNVAAVQPTEFSDRFKRAHLHRKLANIVTEVAEGGTIADAELKAITSGELITADHKHQPPFDFNPYSTCWFGTNHLPRTKDYSDALYRRAVIITFNRKFTAGVDADPNLKMKLLEELPGILKLALDAYAQALIRNYIMEPPSSVKAKNTWRAEEDHLSNFVEECCVLGPFFQESSGVLYQSYRDWALETGVKQQLSRNAFSSRLFKLGCDGDRTSKSRLIKGIRLKNGAE